MRVTFAINTSNVAAMGVRGEFYLPCSSLLCKNLAVRKVTKLQSATWPKLLKAILDDDNKKVARLLADDPTLARRTEDKGQFIAPRALAPAGLRIFDSGKSGVAHWFYRGDTALHLCAAAHRAELARLLLRHGADANA